MILGIETSCDETAAALVTDEGEIRSNVVSSQAELHARYGGVVPEVASRRHLELVTPVIREALAEADATLDGRRPHRRDPRPRADRRAPRRASTAAKAVAWSRRLPLVPVDHLDGHVASLYLQPEPLEPPFLCLLASGGHTLLLDVRSHTEQELLGSTLDDAAGEAFDKGARLLGLGYPGGREIDRLAREGDPDAYDFPVARVPGLDFSFSGLKTALLYAVRDLGEDELDARRADFAASYQQAIVRALVERVREAAEHDRPRPDRDRRRCRRELGTAGCAPGCDRGTARPLHRQRGDDRLGRPLDRGGRVPAVPRPGRVRVALSSSRRPFSGPFAATKGARP